MATTVDLGKVRPVWKGTWSGSTAYEVHDMVKNGVNSYICTTGHTSSGTFSNDSANWDDLAQGANIPVGATSGQLLTATGASTYSWQDAPASDDASALTTGTISAARLPTGSIIQPVQHTSSATTAFTSNGWVNIGQSVTITPTSSSSKILFYYSFGVGSNDEPQSARIKRNSTVVGANANASGDANAAHSVPGMMTNYSVQDRIGHVSGMYMDSPNTTSAVSYTIDLTPRNEDGNKSWRLNSPWNSNTSGYQHWTLLTFIAMEVK